MKILIVPIVLGVLTGGYFLVTAIIRRRKARESHAIISLPGEPGVSYQKLVDLGRPVLGWRSLIFKPTHYAVLSFRADRPTQADADTTFRVFYLGRIKKALELTGNPVYEVHLGNYEP